MPADGPPTPGATLRTYDYNGVLTAISPIPDLGFGPVNQTSRALTSPAQHGAVSRWIFDPSSVGCSGSATPVDLQWSVVQQRPGDTDWSYTMPRTTTTCAAATPLIFGMRSLPDGGVIVNANPTAPTADEWISALEPPGRIRWSESLGLTTPTQSLRLQDVRVSSAGYIVLVESGSRDCGTPIASCAVARIEFRSEIDGQPSRAPIEFVATPGDPSSITQIDSVSLAGNQVLLLTTEGAAHNLRSITDVGIGRDYADTLGPATIGPPDSDPPRHLLRRQFLLLRFCRVRGFRWCLCRV